MYLLKNPHTLKPRKTTKTTTTKQEQKQTKSKTKTNNNKNKQQIHSLTSYVVWGLSSRSLRRR